jgi:hypothetical protein
MAKQHQEPRGVQEAAGTRSWPRSTEAEGTRRWPRSTEAAGTRRWPRSTEAAGTRRWPKSRRKKEVAKEQQEPGDNQEAARIRRNQRAAF